MIKFSNGHNLDFCSASGAMGFWGDGWWFESPSRLMNTLRPQDFTIIIKTLTFNPTIGNYKWWAPWQCVRLLSNDSVVNAVGLTNPGYLWWVDKPYQHCIKKGYKVIVSIMPKNTQETIEMIIALNKLKIVGIQLNLSCPNVKKNDDLDFICEIVHCARNHSEHPLSLKLSYQNDYLAICKELDGKVEAFELINSIPFNIIYPGQKSPLAKYGLSGGVSGKEIKKYSMDSLRNVKNSGIKTPIMSGGGIMGEKDVLERWFLDAEAIVFGSIFMRRCALPNLIIDKMRK